jgi:polysaccharide deacetylase 2 family uncharacterized protein YibQ
VTAAARRRRRRSTSRPIRIAVGFGVVVVLFAVAIWLLAVRGPERRSGEDQDLAGLIERLAERHGASQLTRDDPIRKDGDVFVRTWRVVLPDVDSLEGFLADLGRGASEQGATYEPVERGPRDAARVRVGGGIEAFDVRVEVEPPRVAHATPTPTAAPSPTPTVRPTLPPDRRGRLAILLDDAGQSLDLVDRAAQLPDAVAVAVLPFLPKSSETAAALYRAGHEVWLHLPMEATGGENPGPGAVMVDMTPDEVRRTVHSALNSVPHVVGVNNHMGSRATADLRTMTWVMQELSSRNVAFLDSRTTVQTVAESAARAQGVPTGRRHVFLDNERSRPAIEAQLAEAEYRARADGEAVAIGHLNAAMVEVLEAGLPGIGRRGIDLVRPSELMR